jgi:ribosomal protein S18 acetylase RimI-like enzyme
VDAMPSLLRAGVLRKNRNFPMQKNAPYENTHHEKMRYEMRFLDWSHLQDVVKLQEIVIHNLSDKEIFRTHPPKYFLEHFKMENSIIGVFTNDGLIAYSVLYFPGERKDSFGIDIGLERDELDKVVHLATVAVHPAYRGNSLQKQMQGIHLDTAMQLGYEHACCMVSPKNRASLQNIFSHGLNIKALKLKFDKRRRYILHRHLLSPRLDCHEEFRIRSSDLDAQIGLLNMGYLGFRMVEMPAGFSISYGRSCN